MSILEALLSPKQKAATGPGVGLVNGGGATPFILSEDPRKKAIQAVGVWRTNLWVRAAERTISTKIGAADAWLTDDEAERVTLESPEPQQAVAELIARPYRPIPGDPITAAPMTKRALWSITSRHMGVVGYSFWYLDQVDALNGAPLQTLYVHPARMLPATNGNGGLVGWVMDYGSDNPVAFETNEVIKFDLEPPDEGFLGTGLVESAIAKVEMSRLTDKHSNQVLASGGRKVGVYSPPAGSSVGEEAFKSIQRDLRAVSDMPDASKRSLVLKGPMEFTETSNTPGQLDLAAMSEMSRDGILALWGVPRSQLGMDVPAGLNSGATKDKDEAVLWENAIGPRIRNITEQVNTQLLPRFEDAAGRLIVTVKEPTYDDDAPRYDAAAKAAGQPLRNVERRAILGLGPIGDPALDDAVWLPVNMVPAFDAPAHDPDATKALGKAKIVNPRLTKQAAKALHAFLKEQGDRIGARIIKKGAAVERKPGDMDAIWNDKEENALLTKALSPFLIEEAKVGHKQATSRINGKAELTKPQAFDEAFLKGAMENVADRVVQVNKATKTALRKITETGVRLGMSPYELGRVVRGWVPPLDGDMAAWEPVVNGAERTFASELRAETIARTEMRYAENAATIATYEDVGIDKVEMMDGDDDEVCAARDGQVVTVAVALKHMEEEHPNGTLDFMPAAI